jgi:PIN domain nuclease of toxin-antitoxin system
VRLLLDTHVWIWSLLDPDRLDARVRRILQRPETEVWLSPISVWEIHVLAEKGRLKGVKEPGPWVRRCLEITSPREAALTFAVALASRELALPHGDPADRFLAATAAVHALKLVTADQNLLRAGVCEVMAA